MPRNQVALARRFRLPAYDVRFNSGASLGLAVPFLSRRRIGPPDEPCAGRMTLVLPARASNRDWHSTSVAGGRNCNRCCTLLRSASRSGRWI